MMKKYVLGILGAMALAGCTEDALTDASSDKDAVNGKPVFTARAEQPSRAQLADDLSVIWQAGDEISIFYNSTYNDEYELQGEGGSTQGTFESVYSVAPFSVSNINGAIYPYQENNEAEMTADGMALTYTFPAKQTYTTGSFDKAAFPMLAVSATEALGFKNAGGVLKLQLTGTETVKSITLTGNNGENLSGQYTTSLTTGGAWGETTATLAGQMVTLDCGTTGVQLNAGTATTFHIVLPPTEFTNGFTVKVKAENTVATLSTKQMQNIRRNEILKMPAMACEFKAPAPTMLIDGNAFNLKIHENATQLTFVPNYPITPTNGTLVSMDGATPAYIIPDESTTEDVNDYLVVTTADEFMFNADCTSMFASKFVLKKIILNGCNTSAVTDMKHMFEDNEDLTELNLGDKFDTSGVTNMGFMFSGCSHLNELNLGDKFDTSKVTDMSSMFSSLMSLNELNLGNRFDTSKVTNMTSMFSNEKLTTINLGDKFDTSKVTDMSHMFDSCTALTSLNLGNNFNTSLVTNMKYMFNSCMALTTLDLGNNFNTSLVTDMNHMFYSCNALTTLDLGNNFNTGEVVNMERMFYKCTQLTDLNLGEKFNTGKVTNMHDMFNFCKALTTLNLGNMFDTSAVTNMKGMFERCMTLPTLNLGNRFNTSQVTDMDNMFNFCKALKTLNLGDNFDTSKVEGMSSMFYECSSLTELNLGNKFNVNATKFVGSMFVNIGGDTTTGASLILSKVTDFSNCTYITALFARAKLRSLRCSAGTKDWIINNANNNSWVYVNTTQNFGWEIYY